MRLSTQVPTVERFIFRRIDRRLPPSTELYDRCLDYMHQHYPNKKFGTTYQEGATQFIIHGFRYTAYFAELTFTL